jgi:predicted permease
MDETLRDVRHGLRRLAHDRGFLAAALLTLALCVGANAAIFSLVRSVLLRPLPFADSDRVVMLYNSYPNAGAARGSNGVPDYYDRREGISAFQESALYRGAGLTVGEEGSPERLQGVIATPSFFRLLGVDAALGRTFTEDEGEPGNTQKVVLSWAYWQDRLGGREDVVGTDLRVNGVAFEVVGVMPRDFLFDSPDTRIWIPAAFTAEERSDERRHSNNWQMIARLRPGTTVEQAQAQIDALNAATDARFPQFSEILRNAGFHTVVRSLRQDVTRDVRGTLLLLQAGALLVLLIGCVNIANLVLVRATARHRELATRLALGAGHARLARQILTDSIVLGLMGGAVGLALGRAGLVLLEALGSAHLPRGSEIAMDGAAVMFAIALSIVAGMLFGLLPVLRLRRTDLSAVFRDEGRSGTAGRHTLSLRGLLVSAQVASAFALLIASGLLLTSFVRTLGEDPGFDTRGVLKASVSLPVTRYPDADARRVFLDRVMHAMHALPGVRSASVTNMVPFSGDNNSSAIVPEGRTPAPGESLVAPMQSFAAPGYFSTMGIEIVQGREFLESDAGDDDRVIIIDEWLARRFWPGENPIGRRVYDGPVGVGMDDSLELYRVIGVARTIRFNDLTGDATPGHYYYPLRRSPGTTQHLIMRTDLADPAAALSTPLRSAVAAMDPDLPVYGIATMEESVTTSLRTERARALLLVGFSGIALLLAAIGIYGVLAYAVSLRSAEIGIRVALGSSSASVFRLIMQEGLRWVGAGLAVGVVAALALGQLLRGLLYGVGAADPGVLIVVMTLITLVSLASCALPAWRAARVDPLIAMRDGQG